MTVIIDGTTGIVGATWTTANRPSSPVVGQRGFNTTLNGAEIYNGEQWNPMSNGFSATGGTITRLGGYTIHTFLSSGTFTPDFAGEVEYLVVGGGGGGGLDAYGSGRGAGGGGAGGFKTSTNFAVAATGLTVTIGAGGAGTNNASAVVGLTGANSVFSSITASGGGGGGGHTASGQVKSGDGASSGGGSNGLDLSAGVGSAIAGQGYQGGLGKPSGSPYQGGGGGGASAVGADASGTVGGAGGAGTYSNFSGSITPYAGGGGGGGGSASVGGVGGVGGGGAGGITSATAGTANTGGGGGGCRSSSFGGGSGIVIIRYPTAGQLSIITSATAGKVQQIVNVQTGAVATGTGRIPQDDTIPQITEGDEYMTLAITPTSATNKLLIESTAMMTVNGGTSLTMALFVGTTANALAAIGGNSNGGSVNRGMTLVHNMVAGTTSELTFRIRLGPNAAVTLAFNSGEGVGTRLYGGVCASSITITEYSA